MSTASVQGSASDTATPPPADDRALRPASMVSNLLRSRATWVFALDVVLVLLFTLVSEDNVFFTIANGRSLLLGATQALLLALGLAMMLGAGIFDLSLGANLVLSSVIGALVIQKFQDPVTREYDSPWTAIWLGLLACVLAGVVFGVVNGILIAVADVNSLIATLATLGIGTGVAYLLSDGADVAGMPFEMQRSIGLNTVGEIPVPALVAVAAAIALWAVVRYTRFGMRTQAIGSSRAAAERAGLKVRQHFIVLTSLAGGLAGVAGFFDLTRFGSTALAGHANDSLAAVTAVVIGGTLLTGGYISIIGAVWGSALAVILQTGLVITGVPSFWRLIVVGVVLLLAVVIDRTTSKRRAAKALTGASPTPTKDHHEKNTTEFRPARGRRRHAGADRLRFRLRLRLRLRLGLGRQRLGHPAGRGPGEHLGPVLAEHRVRRAGGGRRAGRGARPVHERGDRRRPDRRQLPVGAPDRAGRHLRQSVEREPVRRAVRAA